MEGPDQPGSPANASLAQAIDRLWTRFLPEMRERASVLAAAAAALAENNLSAAQCEAAHAAAHKLAGVLGTFNLTHGTVVARELETYFSREGGPGSDIANRLVDAVQELRIMIENRNSAS
jgi:HPt (histidine-containing phosphotransfer) domain-containing protein